MRINTEMIDPALVRQLLTEGGLAIGIGDYRPQKFGPFGTFAPIDWREVEPLARKKATRRKKVGRKRP